MVLGGVEVFTVSVGAPSILDLVELLVSPLFGVLLEDEVPLHGLLLLSPHLTYCIVPDASSLLH